MVVVVVGGTVVVVVVDVVVVVTTGETVKLCSTNGAGLYVASPA